ncbi:hypothetical protein G6F46_015783 [Rhizopus delemar]|nr:hypothetical protein G6F46_015783 [Rhizopus delemar]
MTEAAGAAEQTASLAGSGQVGLARMEDTMRNVVGAAGSVNANGHDDHEGGRPDQPAVAERGNRSREGR